MGCEVVIDFNNIFKQEHNTTELKTNRSIFGAGDFKKYDKRTAPTKIPGYLSPDWQKLKWTKQKEGGDDDNDNNIDIDDKICYSPSWENVSAYVWLSPPLYFISIATKIRREEWLNAFKEVGRNYPVMS